MNLLKTEGLLEAWKSFSIYNRVGPSILGNKAASFDKTIYE